jgi:hypothetical protein
MSEVPPAEPLPVAVRAYAPPPSKKRRHKTRSGPRRAPIPPSDYSLVFDCETTSDTAQALRIGAFQVRQGEDLARAGFFYEPDILGTEGLDVLRSYTEDPDLELLTRDEFVEDVFFHYAADLGGLCIGFNLPFDISRVAINHVRGRGSSRQAFSFELSRDKRRDRVRVQHRSANASRIEFVPRHKRRATDHPGHFVDVKTLARALTGSSHSLASLTDHLKTPHHKSTSDEHGGPLTPEYLDYAYNDVQATWECYSDLNARYLSFALDTPVAQIMSEAGIGKASLRQMGIRPWRNVQSDFPPELLGQVMSTYSGGRAEVRLRKEIAEVAYCDFKSMYPTVCALQGLWRFVIAEGVDHADATEDVRALLEHIELDDLQDPKAWEQLTAIAQVEPDGDIFPVRAQYGGGEQYGLAQNYLSSSTGERFWFTLADCIATKLRTGKAPKVIQAIRLTPRPPQDGLEPIDIAGNPNYRIDPYTDDFYVRLIDQRTEVKRQATEAKQAGNTSLAERLHCEQLSLKITANATSYGVYIELNPHELDTPGETFCYGLDGARFTARVPRYERPGMYFHPLLATLITGAARLKLTLAELLAQGEGIDWAFCDTDSLALAKPADMPREVFEAAVRRVRAWFRPLSPYERSQELFELEDTNFALGDPDRREPLYCYAISPKRHALYNHGPNGRPIIRKGSAHGLGHLMAPYSKEGAPGDIPAPAVPERDLELQRWQYDLWYRILEAAIDDRAVDLDGVPGFDRPAMARVSVTRPAVESWFRPHNRNKHYNERTRPFGFLITPTVRALDKPLGSAGRSFHLVAPYEKASAKWIDADYFDIYSGESYRVSTTAYGEGVAKVQTYRDHAVRYAKHPDPKRLGPDGTPCRTLSTGLLSPRHVDAFDITQIGKEVNRLDEVEAGLVRGAEEVYTVYSPPRRDRWTRFVVPTLRQIGRSALLATGALRDSALREVLAARARPHPSAQARLTAIAVRHARAELENRGEHVPTDTTAMLYSFLATARPTRGHCAQCGRVTSGRRTFCSGRCRQRAYRLRHSTARERL